MMLWNFTLVNYICYDDNAILWLRAMELFTGNLSQLEVKQSMNWSQIFSYASGMAWVEMEWDGMRWRWNNSPKIFRYCRPHKDSAPMAGTLESVMRITSSFRYFRKDMPMVMVLCDSWMIITWTSGSIFSYGNRLRPTNIYIPNTTSTSIFIY